MAERPSGPKEPKDRIIIPLDVADIEQAVALVSLLSPHVGLFKLGLEIFWSSFTNLLLLPEEAAIAYLRQARALAKTIGAEHAFIDGKLADIPNTVGGASVAISKLGVAMFNVHASAGAKAVRAAVEAVKARQGPSMVLGVTVLTSIDSDECVSIFGEEPGPKVIKFAQMLEKAGADGIICAPKELAPLKVEVPRLLRVTPNIRPIWARKKDDQDTDRQMTPAEAIQAGADYLVIGRPVTRPPAEIGGPVEAAKRIADEIAGALSG